MEGLSEGEASCGEPALRCRKERPVLKQSKLVRLCEDRRDIRTFPAALLTPPASSHL